MSISGPMVLRFSNGSSLAAKVRVKHAKLMHMLATHPNYGYSSDLETQRNEPPRGKTNEVVSEQVRHKPACTVTEKS